jgi:predicted pyridoxine 5'-phosphate oxidase superfamily flavin-nucleotide-binding protein
MISNDARKLLESNPVALATSSLVEPDVAVVADVKVLGESKLLIGDNYLTTTKVNIEKNGKVSLVVWNPEWQNSCFGYKITGKAVYETVGPFYDMIQLIHAGFPAKGAIIVTVNKIKRIGD